MKKSTIIATVVVVLVVALLASYMLYGSNGGGDSSDSGTDNPDSGEESVPMLQNFANTSSFFEVYKDGALFLGQSVPCALQSTGNVFELRSTSHVTGVTDNGNGTYTFTLSTEPDAKTLTVEVRGATNLTSTVDDGIITLTFDAPGTISLFVNDNFFDDF